MMNAIVQDVIYAARLFRKNPGFLLASVITLALGIGGNTAIFSAVNAVILRALPFEDSDRLVRIWESNPGRGWPTFSASAPNFLDWRSQVQSFDELAALDYATFNLTGSGDPERITAASITANLLPALGVSPVRGRNFLDEEEQPGNSRVVILSHGLWQRRFGADPGLVGSTIQLNGESYAVVGVLPQSYGLALGAELWVPLTFDPADRGRAERANHTLMVFGKLKPDVSLGAADAELKAIASRLETDYPKSNTGWTVATASFYDWIVPQQTRTALLVLLAAVGFVLLIACSNVANLFLGRAISRHREVAIRSALGASRSRVMRQFLIESMLLALVGGGLGVLLALWGVDVLRPTTSLGIPRLDQSRIDARVLVFTLTVSVLASLLFGLVPALQASRSDLCGVLKEGGRSVSPGRHLLGRVLVTVEIALALVLLVGSGLMLRSFARLQNVALGFKPERILTMQLALPVSQYRQGTQRTAFFAQLLERLRVTPGVSSAAAISQVPFSPGNWAMEIAIEGRDPASGDTLSADARAITPGYFQAMGIPLVEGREFTDQDGPDAATMIISERMKKQFWPDATAIGKRFRPGSRNPWMTIIGVVGDVRNLALNQDPRPAFYFCNAQLGFGAMTLVVRTEGEPATVEPAVRAQVAALDSNLPVFNVQSMETIVTSAGGVTRFQTVLLGVFGVVALVLAIVGVYGVISYSVGQRAHEMGVRMALGAQRGDVLRLVVGQAAALATIGVALGLCGAFALTRFIRGMLFEVSPSDPATFAAVSAVLLCAALAASYIPARRASKVDPMAALRSE